MQPEKKQKKYSKKKPKSLRNFTASDRPRQNSGASSNFESSSSFSVHQIQLCDRKKQTQIKNQQAQRKNQQPQSNKNIQEVKKRQEKLEEELEQNDSQTQTIMRKIRVVYLIREYDPEDMLDKLSQYVKKEEKRIQDNISQQKEIVIQPTKKIVEAELEKIKKKIQYLYINEDPLNQKIIKNKNLKQKTEEKLENKKLELMSLGRQERKTYDQLEQEYQKKEEQLRGALEKKINKYEKQYQQKIESLKDAFSKLKEKSKNTKEELMRVREELLERKKKAEATFQEKQEYLNQQFENYSKHNFEQVRKFREKWENSESEYQKECNYLEFEIMSQDLKNEFAEKLKQKKAQIQIAREKMRAELEKINEEEKHMTIEEAEKHMESQIEKVRKEKEQCIEEAEKAAHHIQEISKLHKQIEKLGNLITQQENKKKANCLKKEELLKRYQGKISEYRKDESLKRLVQEIEDSQYKHKKIIRENYVNEKKLLQEELERQMNLLTTAKKLLSQLEYLIMKKDSLMEEDKKNLKDLQKIMDEDQKEVA